MLRGSKLGNSPRISNSPTPSFFVPAHHFWGRFFVTLQHFGSVFFQLRLKAFPFDQQSLQVVVASEKLMADEMVRSPKSSWMKGVGCSHGQFGCSCPWSKFRCVLLLLFKVSSCDQLTWLTWLAGN